MTYVFGVDVGGTTIKTALVTDEGKVVYKYSFDTESHRGFEVMVDRLHEVMRQSCAECGIAPTEVAAMGVGLPAFLSRDRRIIREAVNLGWTDVPLQDFLERRFNIPVTLENDANVAALGESWLGAGRNADNVLCVTVGTGIGGGIVLKGEILRGVNGMAGELGHLMMQPDGPLCNCGQHGCLETLASATAMIRRAKEMQSLGKISWERDIRGAVDVFQLADAGDAGAAGVIAEAAGWLGKGLALAATVTNPETIVIGGGVSSAGAGYLKAVEETFKEYALNRISEGTNIVLAALGNDAGVIGAARVALQR